MTDLLHTIPDFPTRLYTHLLPSLEKHLITTTDILTLDALEVAKRAQLPLLDVRRLAIHVTAILQGQLGLQSDSAANFENVGKEQPGYGSLRKSGKEAATQWTAISTLDLSLDALLHGGIPTGCITEITGERYSFYPLHLVKILIFFQWCRQDPATPHPPPQRPTPFTPRTCPHNPLHIHRTPTTHHSCFSIARQSPNPFISPQSTISKPYPHSQYARSRIARPHPHLPAPRRTRTSQRRPRDPR